MSRLVLIVKVLSVRQRGNNMQASLKRVHDKIVLHSPYNALLVEAIHGIPGSRWNGSFWLFPAACDQQVRELVREFFQFEGEPCYISYKEIRIRVQGSHIGWVRIDGRDLFPAGYLDMQSNDAFEILDYAGGFLEPFKKVRDRHQGFKVEYTLRLKIREDARIETHGNGSYEVLSDGPIEQFLQELLERE
jgi:hypothetical protein